MRIGGGSYRSRTLRTPKGDLTRPTSGMVRETLFNMLAPLLPEASFLDLFAGCGSVGLEALSRGAASATFVESARPALDCLRANIETLGVAGQTSVLPYPVLRALEQLTQQGESFDIIFLDPPFHDSSAYQQVLDALAPVEVLAPDGLIIAQHGPRVKVPEQCPPFTRYRQRDIGDNVLSFYRRVAK
ncbi:MAG TPA: 16S rRNA (guanine(966)-N(2))-methyltransferase RsmD [Armatimonadota bacterium]|jgi:16S rRNA (guanine(966)-N(2))-methyltransferase RsmD